jgi:hypothetical protein
MVPPKAGRFIALNLTYSERINRETGWCKFGIWRTTDMPLRYEDVSRFAREHGNVKGFAEKSAVTLLKSGDIDSVAFFEKDAVQFEHKGKSYERVEFEKLVESKSKLIAGQE